MRTVRRALGLLVVVLLVAIGWVGVRGALAYRHLQRVQAAEPALRAALTDTDPTRAATLGAQIHANAAAADRLTGDPVWRLAGHLPVVGRDLSTTHALAHTVDGLATGVVDPLVRVMQMVANRPASTGGALSGDLTLVTSAGSDIDQAATAVDVADTQLDALPSTGLARQLTAAIATVRSGTGAATAPLATASTACRVLPAMLDPTTPKSYLLLFQNLAEARSLGGIVGAYAVIRIDDGTVTLTAQGAGAKVPAFTQPVLSLDPGYHQLFADQPARYFLDTTTAPYFPDTAQLAREMWRRHSGQTVDGVISVDPVALSYLLAATGPVSTPGGPTVDSADAARVLLHDVYARYPNPATEDAVFAHTAAAVLGAVTGYHGAPRPLLTAFARAATEHRLLVWSADPAVARSLAGTAVAGVPATGPGGGARNVGIYLNEGTSSKLSWYLERQVSLREGSPSGGHRSVDARIALTSTVPAGGRGLPSYVLGNARAGASRVIVLVLAPAHAAVMSATVDGKPVALGSATLHGRGAVTFAVDLPPGGTITASVTLLVSDVPGLDLQPLAH